MGISSETRTTVPRLGPPLLRVAPRHNYRRQTAADTTVIGAIFSAAALGQIKQEFPFENEKRKIASATATVAVACGSRAWPN